MLPTMKTPFVTVRSFKSNSVNPIRTDNFVLLVHQKWSASLSNIHNLTSTNLRWTISPHGSACDCHLFKGHTLTVHFGDVETCADVILWYAQLDLLPDLYVTKNYNMLVVLRLDVDIERGQVEQWLRMK